METVLHEKKNMFTLERRTKRAEETGLGGGATI